MTCREFHSDPSGVAAAFHGGLALNSTRKRPLPLTASLSPMQVVLAPFQGAILFFHRSTGGIALLNPRLIAGTPTGVLPA